MVGFKGVVSWDKSKPDGTDRKLLDSRRINSFGWTAKINLDAGIKETYDWFVNNKFSN